MRRCYGRDSRCVCDCYGCDPWNPANRRHCDTRPTWREWLTAWLRRG